MLFTLHNAHKHWHIYTHWHAHTKELTIAFVNCRRIFQDVLFSPTLFLSKHCHTMLIFPTKSKEGKNPQTIWTEGIYLLQILLLFCSSIILCSIKLPCSSSCADFEFPSVIRSFHSFWICWKEKRKRTVHIFMIFCLGHWVFFDPQAFHSEKEYQRI